MGIYIIQKGITNFDTDAIVNAANSHLAEGSGICGAIFSAAGSAELTKACKAIGYCDTGNAVITPGFNLDAKYIIHAVGPKWVDGKHGEPSKLYDAYKNSLELAVFEEYAPKMLSAEEVEKILTEKYADVIATKNRGQIMKTVMPDLKGKADGKVINEVVAKLCQ